LIFYNSSTVIQDIQSTAKEDSIGLAYFYCDVADAKKRNVTDILNSLVLHLLSQQPSSNPLDKTYEDCMHGLSRPSEDKLLEVLRQLICGFEITYILIDALDECFDWEETLEFIEILHKWELWQCHLLVTSRKEQQIIESIMAMNPMEVDMSQMPVHNDIEKYIDSTIQSSVELKKWKTSEKGVMKELLLEKAKGM
jgi:hypothetical protein